MLESFKDKKILILGFAREGRDTLLFLNKLFPGQIIGIADAKKELKDPKIKAKWHLGPDYLRAISDYDIVVKSPGIPYKKFSHLVKKSQIITSQTEIFLDNCSGQIIGVTGSKGKGTTVSLIYAILKEAGFKVHLVGNIGKPVLSLLLKATPKDVYIYEMSSHQLQNLKKSPHIAVFLNIEQAHLAYYKDFNDYAKAKANITKYQKKDDFLIYNPEDKLIKEFAKNSKAKKIAFGGLGIKIKEKDILLKGDFNKKNIAAAVAVAKIFKTPEVNIISAIKKFKPLPYRLEYIGKFKGINFYNDSLATIPVATVRALEVLGNRVETIILGGFEDNVDYKDLAQKVLSSGVKTAVLFLPSGQNIWCEIEKAGKGKKIPKNYWASNMEEAVRICYQETKKGKICLLSCASPSYGLFKNYKERGDLFKKYVKAYAKSL